MPFNFLSIYGNDRQSTGFACTRRVWRVFTLAAPSLLGTFSPYTDGLGTFGFGPDGTLPYPFSVKPDVPLTVQDIMNMNRDQYEGSAFDLTKGADGGTCTLSSYLLLIEGVTSFLIDTFCFSSYSRHSFYLSLCHPLGPFGDPMRWPAMSKFEDKIQGVSWDAQQSGLGFQRPISLWRTGKL